MEGIVSILQRDGHTGEQRLGFAQVIAFGLDCFVQTFGDRNTVLVPIWRIVRCREGPTSN